MIKFIKAENYEDMGRIAGDIIWNQIKEKENCVLGLATGSTPISTYDYLTEKSKEDKNAFENVRTVNLDEYMGLEISNDQSYHYFMNTNFWSRVGIKEENRRIPSGTCADMEEECKRYEAQIEEFGGIDLQLLGIGGNGHIGFNEPGDVFVADTHVVELTEETRQANARFFESIDDVPKYAVTMGIATIMKAKKILLVANGEGKADALASLFKGVVDPRVQVTCLLLHPDVTIVADEAALSKCNL